ncbi:surface antigen [Plasmodium falciparum UGT5.1]|uniref:Surface antigen n=1 Tax=Plasmodium falciparum UGT5.1 TaxID=1237627 RepID=W7JNN9_PLAFA|nr:surface antigen [Plasmodium falciparum UGT5.1]
MRVHYINILFFGLPLNILVHNQRNHNSTTPHTPKIPTTRSLCECELYAPANYDSVPQMKEVMNNFNKQAQRRFQEYDDRMIEKRKQCKEQCAKEIQKIILKDKLEKQMEEQLTTLETKIGTDDIPTCICEKSLADKVEKGCLRSGGVLGGGVMPSIGLLGGIGEGAISVLQPLALVAAKEEALAEATSLATKAGVKAVVSEINKLLAFFKEEGFVDFTSVVKESNFSCGSLLHKSAKNLLNNYCNFDGKLRSGNFCPTIYYGDTTHFGPYAKAGTDAYNATLASQTTTLTDTKVGAVEATYGGYHISIIASIVAIVVIVLIMVIIYLILRYRRKKKMKKKLQYIKLLEE